MPADLDKIKRDKEKIISTIKDRGPSLLVHLSKALNTNMIFTSAYLSELVAEKKVKKSHMKIGSSPLFFLEGQENLLENFIDYLNPKEKEAYLLLKNSKVLLDDLQVPAIRVALREIKDFAFPLELMAGDERKLAWRHYLVKDEEVKDLLNKRSDDSQKNFSDRNSPESFSESKKEVKNDFSDSNQKKEVDKSYRSRKTKKNNFEREEKMLDKLKSYLSSKKFEIIEEGILKKKEVFLIAKLVSNFGEQEYFVYAKDKKKISEEDLSIVLLKAQERKMPSIFFTNGSLDNSSIKYLNEWKNLIRVEALSF